MNQKITVQTTINAPLVKVWQCWITPADIDNWAFASDDWEASGSQNDLRIGGKFKTTMSAKDKSGGFDFAGTYTLVEDQSRIEYNMADGRHVKTEFKQTPDGVVVTEVFDPETENPAEKQRTGWQGILENFKKYVEGKK